MAIYTIYTTAVLQVVQSPAVIKMLHVLLVVVWFVLQVQQPIFADFSPVEWREYSEKDEGHNDLSQILTKVAQMISTNDKLSSLPKSCQEIKGTTPSSPSGHYTVDRRTGNEAVIYCDMDNLGSQECVRTTLPITCWPTEIPDHSAPLMSSITQLIAGNQESLEQSLVTLSTTVAATNIFIEQVAGMQEKISQALITASAAANTLAEQNKELVKNQKSMSKKLDSITKVTDKIIQEIANGQWTLKEVKERMTSTGDATYQLAKQLATNQKVINQTLTAIATSTMSVSNKSSTTGAQQTVAKEAKTPRRVILKTERTVSSSEPDDEDFLSRPIEGYYPSSCQSIKLKDPSSNSGVYTLYDSGGKQTREYCYFDLCNTPGHWKRVAFLNMSNATHSCPSGFTLYSERGVRACGRSGSQASCKSVKFSITSPFQQVCGRVIGYQFGNTDGFSGDNISAPYVDGVSLTHGSPRRHIWSFAAVQFLSMYHWCPCVGGLYASTSDIISSDYFCETGYHGTPEPTLYVDNPLWDGRGCTNDEAPCCQVHGIPWFHKYLATPTTDFIELRLCGRQTPAINNTPLSLYEIYVK